MLVHHRINPPAESNNPIKNHLTVDGCRHHDKVNPAHSYDLPHNAVTRSMRGYYNISVFISVYTSLYTPIRNVWPLGYTGFFNLTACFYCTVEAVYRLGALLKKYGFKVKYQMI